MIKKVLCEYSGANSFDFHVPANYQVLEEFLTARSKKSNKFPYKVSFSLPYFDFFDFAVIFFFKACYFKGNFDAENLNEFALVNIVVPLYKTKYICYSTSTRKIYQFKICVICD
jgi:hypothetical protein